MATEAMARPMIATKRILVVANKRYEVFKRTVMKE